MSSRPNTYGSHRIHHNLKDQGLHVGCKRAVRIMRDIGIKGRVVTLTRRALRFRRFQQAGENLRLKSSPPNRYDQQWVADITYIKVEAQYQYLVTIMDVYSRRILGWPLNRSRSVGDLLPLLQGDRQEAPRPGLIIHTDRGIEFKAYAI
ncbi:MAG: transposase [Saccharospirillum sp.]